MVTWRVSAWTTLVTDCGLRANPEPKFKRQGTCLPRVHGYCQVKAKVVKQVKEGQCGGKVLRGSVVRGRIRLHSGRVVHKDTKAHSLGRSFAWAVKLILVAKWRPIVTDGAAQG